MNFKFINRKQALGISHAEDFSNWAIVVGEPMIENTVHADNVYVGSLLCCEHDITDSCSPNVIQETLGMFDRAIDALKLNFVHSEIDTSLYVKAIQSIDATARKRERYFQMIDIRPISELGTDVVNIELVDKMMVECGCNAIDDSWFEYSQEDGRKTLNAIFEAEVVPEYYVRGDREKAIVKSALANRFLAHFDETVHFYGNASEAPWEEGYKSRPYILSKLLQTRFETDFGLVLCDNKTIGFLLVASDRH